MQPEKIHQGVADRATTFALLNRYQRGSELAHLGLRPGQFFEVEEEEYWYFLEVLFPLDMHGGSFAMREFVTGNLTETFHEFTVGGRKRWFCALVDWSTPRPLMSMRGLIWQRELEPAAVL